MSTDALHAPRDAQIDLQEDAGLGYWKQRFGCSATELLAAMESVGRNPSDVAQFLGSRSRGDVQGERSCRA